MPSSEMLLPSASCGTSARKNGPRTVLGVRRLRTARIDFLDQRRSAEQIGQQHPFLAPLVAGMADIGEEFDHLAPVRLRSAAVSRMTAWRCVDDGRQDTAAAASSFDCGSRCAKMSDEVASLKFSAIGPGVMRLLQGIG